MFIAQAARKLPFQVEIAIYDASEQACARTAGDSFYCGAFDDEQAIRSFAADVDIVTYEFENISPTVVGHLDNALQGSTALRTLQNRYLEKEFINSLPGIPCVPYALVTENFSFDMPFVAKTAELGYDGKGQYIITNYEDLAYVKKGMIAERFLPDITEYSIIIARNINGTHTHYPVFENVHVNQILDTTRYGSIPAELEKLMYDKAILIAESLNYYGVLAVEFFLSDHSLYVNEVAPRVHNSGHITLDSANVSQFDLHLYSLFGIDFPPIEVDRSWCMVNVLGQHYEAVKKRSIAGKFYDYGKKSTQENRKVGHINGKLQDLELLKEVRLS